jgi:hypothetical protein
MVAHNTSQAAGSVLDDIEAGSETLTIAKASRLPELKVDGRPRHIATLYRWIERGIDGVHLEAVRIGGVRVTSRPAVLRFLSRLNATTGTVAITPAGQRRQASRLDRELAAAGI